ncbi:MAG TPA: substrate-binding domain-containing protein, partial [Anaerolineales bacterium]
ELAINQCYEAGLPMVFIHQTPPVSMSIPCVTVENKAASAKIVEHLIVEHHRRRIVYMSGPETHEDSIWRRTGYAQALSRNGIPMDPDLILKGEFDREIAQVSMAQFLAAGGELDAVFSGDDESAIGVLAALQAAGMRVPEQVSVVGFDDQRLSSFLNPPLTTVRAPTEEVGRTAARQLICLIRTGQADPLTLLPTEIVIRRSCGCSGAKGK